MLTTTSIAESASDINLGPLIWQLALQAAPWVMLFGGIGLLLAIIACVMLARKGLLQRHLRGWHLAAKLSYVVILLALPLAGAGLGIVHGSQRAFAEGINSALIPVLEQRMPAVRVYLTAHLAAYQPDKPASLRELIAPLVQQLHYRPRSDSVWERTKARWINELLLQRAAAQFAQVLQQQLTAQAERVGAALTGPDFHGQAGSDLARLGSDMAVKFTTNMAKEIDFSVLDKTLPQLFADAVIRQFNIVSSSARTMILAMLCGLLLLVAAEIVIYRRYFSPPLKMVLAGESAPAAIPASPSPLRSPSPTSARRPLSGFVYVSLFVRCWLVLVLVALCGWLFESSIGESTLPAIVPIMGVAIAAVAGVPAGAVLVVVYAFYRRRLDPDCSPAAFAWAYAGSLVMLIGILGSYYDNGIEPENSFTVLVLMIVVPWMASLALCLTARYLLLRMRSRR